MPQFSNEQFKLGHYPYSERRFASQIEKALGPRGQSVKP
jgi:hypothetical protein